ncbi:MAG: hypothetical protein M3Z24_14755, partial [Chloroflexota bacterium]|nr:hypothetical protein [Chloroflexota bacterium]
MTTIDTLSRDFVVRPPTMEDLQAVYELVLACDMADDGMLDHPMDEIRSYWQEPGFSMRTDAWMVFHPDGRLLGYADVGHHNHVRIFAFIQVLPKYRGQGIERYLLECTEARARLHIPYADPEARVTLASWMSQKDKVSAQLLEREGFMYVRSFWRMEIKLEAEPQVPEWPDGITVRTLGRDTSAFIHGQQEEHKVFEMMGEAFSDHWGHMPSTFEEWSYWKFQPETFDPTLWFLAFDG